MRAGIPSMCPRRQEQLNIHAATTFLNEAAPQVGDILSPFIKKDFTFLNVSPKLCFFLLLREVSPVSGSDITMILSQQVVSGQKTNTEEKHNREH